MSEKFSHCHFDSETGMMWCRWSNGSWAPPFKVSQSSSNEEEYVKTSSKEDQIQDEVVTKEKIN